jgi:hypothetical protein
VVVQLGIAGAMVLVAGGLSMGFLGQWCHIVVESIGEFHIVIVEGIGGVVFGYAAEVGEVDWGCFDSAAARTEVVASVPVGEGSQWCTSVMSLARSLLIYCLQASTR